MSWNYAVPVWHTCGHPGLFQRQDLESANYVANYAGTVLCWSCWVTQKDKREKDAKLAYKNYGNRGPKEL